MYGSHNSSVGESEWTAFRRAEKKYKLYYEPNSKSSKKKTQPKHVDLSEVLDFKLILERYVREGHLLDGITARECGFGHPVFCLKNHPGFYFIPGALSLEEQCRWIKTSLTEFPQPPNRTNHNAIYGPLEDLFGAAKENKILVQDPETNSDHFRNEKASEWRFCTPDAAQSQGKSGKLVPASVLLRKLRWSTLGLQFDWSKRNYDISLPHNKIPDALCLLARTLATPAMPVGEEFQPEGAIVNYFGAGDTLGGHLDDMEADWSKPIVSLSLGCKAIFLLGGKSREDPPVAMFLRSGDAILMVGEARECFHGVPRIFSTEEQADIAEIESQLSGEEDQWFMEYIRTSRININIRQVL